MMKKRTMLAAGAVLLLLPALTGCGNAAEKAAEEAVEQGIEAGTGTDVEIDDGGVAVTDEQGNEFSAGGGAELPDSWPDAVPVPDGELAFGAATGDGAVDGVWTVDGSLGEVYSSYETQLAGAGFTVRDQVDLGTGRTATFTGNGYDVTVIAGEADGKTSLNIAAVPSS